jgi:hypothetical protein
MTAIGSILPDPAARAEAAGAGQQTAIVTALVPGGVMLQRSGVPVFARVALSCLVRPEPGDTVLSIAADGVWVLAILTRETQAPLRLLAEGDAIIGSETARLTVQAAKGEFFIRDVLHIGQALTAHVARLKLLGGVIETLAERVCLMARRSQRVIEESDQTKARSIEQTATHSLHLQADCAFITGGTAIRMDAAQIHMG